MSLKRRAFINVSAMAAGAGIITGFTSFTAGKNRNDKNVTPYELQSMSMDAAPITLQERMERIAKAQRLLIEQKMEALVIDAGTTLKYFTGISWWPSERTMVAIIPAKGEVKYVCPGFEEERLRELIKIGKEVYAWQEDESPYKQIVKVFKDAGIEKGTVGIEERLRFFILDGIKKEAAHLNFVSGDPVTVP